MVAGDAVAGVAAGGGAGAGARSVMEQHFERFAAGFLVAFMVLLLGNPHVFAATPAFQQMDDIRYVWGFNEE